MGLSFVNDNNSSADFTLRPSLCFRPYSLSNNIPLRLNVICFCPLRTSILYHSSALFTYIEGDACLELLIAAAHTLAVFGVDGYKQLLKRVTWNEMLQPSSTK